MLKNKEGFRSFNKFIESSLFKELHVHKMYYIILFIIYLRNELNDYFCNCNYVAAMLEPES